MVDRMVSYRVWYAISAFFFAMLFLTLLLEALGVFHDLGLVLAIVEVGLALGGLFLAATTQGLERLAGGQADIMATQQVLVRGQDHLIEGQGALIEGVEHLRADADRSLLLQEAMLDRHERSNLLLREIRDLLQGGRGAPA